MHTTLFPPLVRWAKGLGITLFAVLAIALPVVAQTQITTGTIQGTVADVNGAALAGATIEIKNLDTNLSKTLTTDEDGRFVARTDGAYPGIRLGIEAHSRKFHFGLDPEQRDEDRDLRVAAAGWELLYLGHQHTKRPEQVASVVVAAVRERAKLFA